MKDPAPTVATDRRQPLVLGDWKVSRGWLVVGLALLLCAAALPLTGLRTSHHWFMFGLAVLLGVGATVYGVVALLMPATPLAVMFDDGIWLRIPGVSAFIVPWQAVQDIVTIDVDAVFRGESYRIEGVTALVVSRAFYDRHVKVRPSLLKPFEPGNYFIPKGDTVQIAVHHKLLPMTAEDLRAAMEAHWARSTGTARPG